MTPKIKVGDILPNATFPYVPWTQELEDNLACGIGSKVSTDDWKGKKVVLISVPGAFTRTCHMNHLPPFINRYDEFKNKGVDIIAVISANDLWVLSGWLRIEGARDKIVGISDVNAEWSASMGLSVDLSAAGLGVRTARYAMIIEDLVVKYIEVEPRPGVSVSGADSVLTKL